MDAEIWVTREFVAAALEIPVRQVCHRRDAHKLAWQVSGRHVMYRRDTVEAAAAAMKAAAEVVVDEPAAAPVGSAEYRAMVANARVGVVVRDWWNQSVARYRAAAPVNPRAAGYADALKDIQRLVEAASRGGTYGGE